MVTPENVNLNVDDLTVAEIEAIEDKLDTSFDSFAQDGAKRGKFLRAIAWISMRRTNPDFSWEEAGNLKITDLTGAERPTSADVPTS